MTVIDEVKSVCLCVVVSKSVGSNCSEKADGWSS